MKALLYLKSFFDDPAAGSKGSMARLCTFLLTVAAAVAIVKGHDAAGAASVLGAVGALFSRAKASDALPS